MRFLIDVLKCYTGFVLAIYLTLLEISVFDWVMTDTFHFDFLGKFIFCLKKSVLFGIMFGAGGILMQKAKKLEQDKKQRQAIDSLL